GGLGWRGFAVCWFGVPPCCPAPSLRPGGREGRPGPSPCPPQRRPPRDGCIGCRPPVRVEAPRAPPRRGSRLRRQPGTRRSRDPADDPPIRRGRRRRSPRSVCERLRRVRGSRRREHPPRPGPICPGIRGTEREPTRILGGSDDPRGGGVPRDDEPHGRTSPLRARPVRLRRGLELSPVPKRIVVDAWRLRRSREPIQFRLYVDTARRNIVVVAESVTNPTAPMIRNANPTTGQPKHGVMVLPCRPSGSAAVG